MTVPPVELKRAFVSAVTHNEVEIDGNALVIKNLDAQQAAMAVYWLWQQGIVKDGEVTGFQMGTEEWEDMGHHEKATVVKRVLPPRAGRPYDIEHNPATRELRIQQDVIDKKFVQRGMDNRFAAPDILLALVDDRQERETLKTVFNALSSAGAASRDQNKIAAAGAAAWAEARKAGLEDKLGHDQLHRALQAFVYHPDMKPFV